MLWSEKCNLNSRNKYIKQSKYPIQVSVIFDLFWIKLNMSPYYFHFCLPCLFVIFYSLSHIVSDIKCVRIYLFICRKIKNSNRNERMIRKKSKTTIGTNIKVKLNSTESVHIWAMTHWSDSKESVFPNWIHFKNQMIS